MSCRATSRAAFARITPVSPPMVNKKTNPRAHIIGVVRLRRVPLAVAIHLNTLIPVGIAITMVAPVKYARESTSKPTVYIWCPHTINPRRPIAHIAYCIPSVPNVFFFFLWCVIMWEIAPNPGKIRIYTSGCPKNQNRCWNKMGSPPPGGSKKDVLQFRSIINIVNAPASTGRARIKSPTVTRTDQINKGIFSVGIPSIRLFRIVVVKLIAPIKEDTPAR